MLEQMAMVQTDILHYLQLNANFDLSFQKKTKTNRASYTRVIMIVTIQLRTFRNNVSASLARLGRPWTFSRPCTALTCPRCPLRTWPSTPAGRSSWISRPAPRWVVLWSQRALLIAALQTGLPGEHAQVNSKLSGFNRPPLDYMTLLVTLLCDVGIGTAVFPNLLCLDTEALQENGQGYTSWGGPMGWSLWSGSRRRTEIGLISTSSL